MGAKRKTNKRKVFQDVQRALQVFARQKPEAFTWLEKVCFHCQSVGFPYVPYEALVGRYLGTESESSIARRFNITWNQARASRKIGLALLQVQWSFGKRFDFSGSIIRQANRIIASFNSKPEEDLAMTFDEFRNIHSVVMTNFGQSPELAQTFEEISSNVLSKRDGWDPAFLFQECFVDGPSLDSTSSPKDRDLQLCVIARFFGCPSEMFPSQLRKEVERISDETEGAFLKLLEDEDEKDQEASETEPRPGGAEKKLVKKVPDITARLWPKIYELARASGVPVRDDGTTLFLEGGYTDLLKTALTDLYPRCDFGMCAAYGVFSSDIWNSLMLSPGCAIRVGKGPKVGKHYANLYDLLDHSQWEIFISRQASGRIIDFLEGSPRSVPEDPEPKPVKEVSDVSANLWRAVYAVSVASSDTELRDNGIVALIGGNTHLLRQAIAEAYPDCDVESPRFYNINLSDIWNVFLRESNIAIVLGKREMQIGGNKVSLYGVLNPDNFEIRISRISTGRLKSFLEGRFVPTPRRRGEAKKVTEISSVVPPEPPSTLLTSISAIIDAEEALLQAYDGQLALVSDEKESLVEEQSKIEAKLAVLEGKEMLLRSALESRRVFLQQFRGASE